MKLFDMTNKYNKETGVTAQPAYDLRQALRMVIDPTKSTEHRKVAMYDSVWDTPNVTWYPETYNKAIWKTVFSYDSEVAFIINDKSLSMNGTLNPMLVSFLSRGKDVHLFHCFADYDKPFRYTMAGSMLTREAIRVYGEADKVYNKYKDEFKEIQKLNKLFKPDKNGITPIEQELVSCRWRVIDYDRQKLQYEQFAASGIRACSTCKHKTNHRDFKSRLETDGHPGWVLNTPDPTFAYIRDIVHQSYTTKKTELEELRERREELQYTHGHIFAYKQGLEDKCEDIQAAKAEAYVTINLARTWAEEQERHYFIEDMLASTDHEVVALLKQVRPDIYRKIYEEVLLKADVVLDESPLTSSDYILRYFEQHVDKSMVYALCRSYDLDMYSWYSEWESDAKSTDMDTLEAMASPSYKPGVYNYKKQMLFPDTLSWVKQYLYVLWLLKTPDLRRPPYVWVPTNEVITTKPVYSRLDDNMDDEEIDYGTLPAQPDEIQYFNSNAYRLADYETEVKAEGIRNWTICPR